MSGSSATPSSTPSPEVTQFGEQRVVDQRLEISIDGQFGPQPLRESVTELNGSSIQRDGSEARIDSGQQSNGEAALRSSELLNYQPSAIGFWSGRYRLDDSDDLTDSQILEMGLGNGDNGLLYRFDAADGTCIRRNAGTTVDLFDAGGDVDTGAIWADRTRPTVLDLKEGAVIGCLFAFYGAGPVIEFGHFERLEPRPLFANSSWQPFLVYCPQLDSQVSGPYMESANLRHSITLKNNGTAPGTGTSVYVGDRQATLYGQRRQLKREYGTKTARPGGTTITVDDTWTPLQAVRLKDPYLGRTNPVPCDVENLQIWNEGSEDVEVQLAVYNRDDVTADQWRSEENNTAIEVADAASDNLGFASGADVDSEIERLLPYFEVESGQNKNESVKDQQPVRRTIGLEQVVVPIARAPAATTTELRSQLDRSEEW